MRLLALNNPSLQETRSFNTRYFKRLLSSCWLHISLLILQWLLHERGGLLTSSRREGPKRLMLKVLHEMSSSAPQTHTEMNEAGSTSGCEGWLYVTTKLALPRDDLMMKLAVYHEEPCPTSWRRSWIYLLTVKLWRGLLPMKPANQPASPFPLMSEASPTPSWNAWLLLPTLKKRRKKRGSPLSNANNNRWVRDEKRSSASELVGWMAEWRGRWVGSALGSHGYQL